MSVVDFWYQSLRVGSGLSVDVQSGNPKPNVCDATSERAESVSCGCFSDDLPLMAELFPRHIMILWMIVIQEDLCSGSLGRVSNIRSGNNS